MSHKMACLEQETILSTMDKPRYILFQLCIHCEVANALDVVAAKVEVF